MSCGPRSTSRHRPLDVFVSFMTTSSLLLKAKGVATSTLCSVEPRLRRTHSQVDLQSERQRRVTEELRTRSEAAPSVQF
eukprot:m.122228 g.122228  ORF g.122228 m.122228 type:complete len:79 (-) comp28906_c1_seq5:631-867(-)